jgi:hypothetical protein
MMGSINTIAVKGATYLDGFRLRVAFTDGKKKIVDFSRFLEMSNKEAISKYKNPFFFKRFRIEAGNIVWGRNWDLIFPVDQLYQGKIK